MCKPSTSTSANEKSKPAWLANLTNGFVGEFMILLGTFQSNKVYAALAVTGVILGAAYMLWVVKKVFFGDFNAGQK